MNKGKIAIIGAGFVGSTTAYTLMLSGLASEIVLVDINKDKADGDALDMNHGIAFVSPVKVSAGDYAACEGADLVIITAGANQKPGETRVDLLKRNTAIFKSILDALLPHLKETAILLVVSNPVDILTYITHKLSGLPKNRIIGSGTVLDTARLKYYIGEHTGVDARNIHTYIIGEHGDTEAAAWSLTSIAGMELDAYCGVCGKCKNGIQACKDEFYHKTKNAAYEIIEKKGATYYAVALAVRRIAEALMGNEHSILTVSSLLMGEYGIDGVCLSVPALVGGTGIEKVLEVPFSEEEVGQLRHSAETLKGLIKDIGLA